MKLKNKILPLLLLASTAVGCTDGFETTNSDPNKLYEVNLQSIFPGTVYKTMNAISELNNNRMWSYSRYITNVAFQTPWNERGDGFYRKFYVEILRDLEELAKAYISEEKEVTSAQDALDGAKDIIAESISDEA